MKRTNKRRVKRGEHVSNRSIKKRRQRKQKSKKIFSLLEKTTEPNIMVNQPSSGGIIDGLRAYLGKKSI
jgi:hypothetical protein